MALLLQLWSRSQLIIRKLPASSQKISSCANRGVRAGVVFQVPVRLSAPSSREENILIGARSERNGVDQGDIRRDARAMWCVGRTPWSKEVEPKGGRDLLQTSLRWWGDVHVKHLWGQSRQGQCGLWNTLGRHCRMESPERKFFVSQPHTSASPSHLSAGRVLTALAVTGATSGWSPNIVDKRGSRLFFTSRRYGGEGAGQQKQKWTYWLWQFTVAMLALTGTLVWSLQLVETMWEVVFPEDFNAMIKHELAEERKRDEFYNIETSLPDDHYFEELTAKDLALVEFTRRLHTSGVGRSLGITNEHERLTFSFISNTSPRLWPEEGSIEIEKRRAPGTRLWGPKFYVEGPAGLALARVRFEQNLGGEWIPVQCKVSMLEMRRDAVLELRSQLPHGIKYMNLDAAVNTSETRD